MDKSWSNPSRIHKTTKNMILYKNLMFIFSLVQYFSKYCRSKNDHARLSHRISFMNTCSPYASVSANLSKMYTFSWPISVAIKCSASVSDPISSPVLNNVSLKHTLQKAGQPKGYNFDTRKSVRYNCFENVLFLSN